MNDEYRVFTKETLDLNFRKTCSNLSLGEVLENFKLEYIMKMDDYEVYELWKKHQETLDKLDIDELFKNRIPECEKFEFLKKYIERLTEYSPDLILDENEKVIAMTDMLEDPIIFTEEIMDALKLKSLYHLKGRFYSGTTGLKIEHFSFNTKISYRGNYINIVPFCEYFNFVNEDRHNLNELYSGMIEEALLEYLKED